MHVANKECKKEQSDDDDENGENDFPHKRADWKCLSQRTGAKNTTEQAKKHVS